MPTEVKGGAIEALVGSTATRVQGGAIEALVGTTATRVLGGMIEALVGPAPPPDTGPPLQGGEFEQKTFLQGQAVARHPGPIFN